jgi:hypothetical protein
MLAAIGPDGMQHDIASLSPAQGIGLDDPRTAMVMLINIIEFDTEAVRCSKTDDLNGRRTERGDRQAAHRCSEHNLAFGQWIGYRHAGALYACHPGKQHL